MFALIKRVTQLENAAHSTLKSSSSTIQDKFKMDIAPYWIATHLTSPVNSKRSFQRMIEEQARPLRKSLNLLNPEMLL